MRNRPDNFNDEELPPGTPLVTTYRFDMDRLAETVAVRSQDALLESRGVGCLYLNPIVTVRSPTPTGQFFNAARKYQGQWCRQFKQIFPNRSQWNAATFVSADMPTPRRSEKYRRFLERALCFTGVLFINGDLVPPHDWKTHIAAATCTPQEQPMQSQEQILA